MTPHALDDEITELRQMHTYHLDQAIQADDIIYQTSIVLMHHERMLEDIDRRLDVCQSVRAAMR
jgi:hypothetical protein